MLVERIGHAGGGAWQLAQLAARVPRLDSVDPALHLANVLEIALHPSAVARVERPTQVGDFAGDEVQNAATGATSLGARLTGAAGAEELIERQPRVADHRQRLGGGGPADRIGVDAGVAVGAAPRLIHVLDAELHRGNRRVLAKPLGIQLVQRRASAYVRALRLLRMRLRQERRARAEVVAANFLWDDRLGGLDVGVTDDRQVAPVGLQRAQRAGGEVEVAADGGRRPEILRGTVFGAARGAMHNLDGDQTGRIGRGARQGRNPLPAGRHEGVQVGQRHGHAQATQEGAAGEMLSGDERHLCSPGSYYGCPSLCAVSPTVAVPFIWNAGLLTMPRMNAERRWSRVPASRVIARTAGMS